MDDQNNNSGSTSNVDRMHTEGEIAFVVPIRAQDKVADGRNDLVLGFPKEIFNLDAHVGERFLVVISKLTNKTDLT